MPSPKSRQPNPVHTAREVARSQHADAELRNKVQLAARQLLASGERARVALKGDPFFGGVVTTRADWRGTMARPRKDERLLVGAEREALAELQPDRPKTDRNATPLVGWHPPRDLLDWLDTETARRTADGAGRGARSAILTEALEMLRDHSEDRGVYCDWSKASAR